MPKVSLPGVGEEDFAYGLGNWVQTTGMIWRNRELMLATRLRAVRLNLARMDVEKAMLEYELSNLEESLVTARAAKSSKPTKDCFFCKRGISSKARVCKMCLRVQPDAFEEVAAKDLDLSRAIASARPEDFALAEVQPSRCAYCSNRLSQTAMVCSLCKRFQPQHVAEVARQDIAALHISQRVTSAAVQPRFTDPQASAQTPA